MSDNQKYLEILNAYFVQQNASLMIDIQPGPENGITVSTTRLFLEDLKALSGDLGHFKIDFSEDFSDSTCQLIIPTNQDGMQEKMKQLDALITKARDTPPTEIRGPSKIIGGPPEPRRNYTVPPQVRR